MKKSTAREKAHEAVRDFSCACYRHQVDGHIAQYLRDLECALHNAIDEAVKEAGT